jgi:hypothetical protein
MDIKIAEVIFGPNDMRLKGKTTRNTTKQVRMETLNIPLSISENIRM